MKNMDAVTPLGRKPAPAEARDGDQAEPSERPPSAADSREVRRLTPQQFYAKLVARADIREILDRLAK